MKTKKNKLKKLGPVIQVCGCGKIDAYLGDKHNCGQEILRREALEYYD